MPICAKHCPYISQDLKGRNITRDEAYYLCGILNAPIVKEYFKTTFSTRSYSIDFNIKIPTYDRNNEHHLAIMQLSKKATRKGVTPEIFQDLDDYYLKLCRS